MRCASTVKLDLGHQDVGAVLVSYGASYDGFREGRTHQAPEDVALLSALPGWTIHVPGHPDEAEHLFRRAIETDDRVYIRLSDEQNHARVNGGGLVVLREGEGPFVLAVGPTLGETLAATADLDVTVAHLATVRPFPREALRNAVRGTDVVLVEPYLVGTLSAEISAALSDRPHRLLALGVPNAEFRHYGDPHEHPRPTASTRRAFAPRSSGSEAVPVRPLAQEGRAADRLADEGLLEASLGR